MQLFSAGNYPQATTNGQYIKLPHQVFQPPWRYSHHQTTAAANGLGSNWKLALGQPIPKNRLLQRKPKILKQDLALSCLSQYWIQKTDFVVRNQTKHAWIIHWSTQTHLKEVRALKRQSALRWDSNQWHDPHLGGDRWFCFKLVKARCILGMICEITQKISCPINLKVYCGPLWDL